MKRYISILFACLCAAHLWAGEWQWSVPVRGYVSPETMGCPTAFLWVPADCERLKAVLVGQHNMNEETLFEMPRFRAALAEMQVGMVWISPGIDYPWDVAKGIQPLFDRALDSLAAVSGYDELKQLPLVPIGHSAMATFPWNFAAWNPERTLAVVSYHGDAPRTNLTGYGGANLEWGRTRNIDGIPGLMVEGEFEWWEARVNPALAFRMMYPESCISFLCDAGRGHFDVSEPVADYIALFIKKALEERWNGDAPLRKVDPAAGWLAERWQASGRKREKAAPAASYRGDRHDAFWYFDREMAELTESLYATTLGKRMQYVSFLQEGALVPYDAKQHVRLQARFQPEEDGLTFHLAAAFTDSSHSRLSDEHAQVRPSISRICGPVEQLDDTTFRIAFYRMGMENRRRTGEIYLLASASGDAHYKSAVQELCLRIPYRLTEGRRQHILFPGLPDVEAGTASLPLQATSDCGLPVSYYVKEGPAVVEGGRLRLTRIPPRAKYPVKVTIVAWQYGKAGRIQTAEPVARTFYIHSSKND